MNQTLKIGDRLVGPGNPVYIVAEVSANHNQSFDRAVQLIRAAKLAGADAIKLQTYTPDTLTLRCDRECFRICEGTLWHGSTLYDLYRQAYTPWEWQPKLKAIAEELGLTLFSTGFDASSVDFLEAMGVPVHKIASFELVDTTLIEKMASTGKPLILSTGMATLAEIDEAVQTARNAGAHEIALLKCTSAYPAPPEEMHLRTITHLAQTFNVVVGLSDHTLGIAVPVAAIALGACIVEKHVTLSRADAGPDSAFSLEPQELAAMVEAIRTAEKALGRISYDLDPAGAKSLAFRRSLFAVREVKRGEPFTQQNVRSIRPSHGLPPRYLNQILNCRASRDIQEGEPLSWDLLSH